MQLIAPDMLAETQVLSTPLCITGLVLGLLLWLSGWAGHRFWIVLVATVVAGLLGLESGRVIGIQPLVTALLLAIAAGLLALALVRIMAFVAGGIGVLWAIHHLAPSWEAPLIWFLLGGLAGVLLFRLWTMALTSFIGTMLMIYAGATLADRWEYFDALGWTDSHSVLLNWICAGGCLLGLMVQFTLSRWWATLKKRRAQAEPTEEPFEEPAIVKKGKSAKTWWTPAWWGNPRQAA